MEHFWVKKRYLYSQLLVLLGLNIFAGLILFGPLVIDHTLYWDHPSWYSFFRDNLHALNYFGEIQWWNPNAATGFPVYYTSFLANSNAAPLFVGLGFFVWVLGLFQIKLVSYYPLYLLFVGLLIPLGFSLGMLSLARQIFKDLRVVFLIIVLASFSPGIVFNASDVSFEPSIYGVLAVSAYLKFQNHPRKLTFLGVAAAVLMLTLALSVSALNWMIIFVPLFMLACLGLSPKSFLLTLKTMRQSVPPLYWIVAAGSILICVLPRLFAFTDGAEIMRSSSGTRTYSYWYLSSGNPLEFLGTNIPGISFTDQQEHDYSWLQEQIKLAPKVLQASFQNSQAMVHFAYTYLGMLTLPLAIIGLLCGRSWWKKRLFTMLGFCATILILSAYSPILSALLAWPSPLRTVNHYSDISFRAGIFLLLILAAGLGLEALIWFPQKVGRALWICFMLTAALAILISIVVLLLRLVFIGLFLLPYLNTGQLTIDSVLFTLSKSRFMAYMSINFCFMVIMIAVLALPLIWIRHSQSKRNTHFALVTIILLTLIDVSTVSFFYTRFIMQPNAVKIQEPALTSIGSPGEMGEYANNLLFLRHVKDLENSGLNIAKLPMFALSTSVQDFSHQAMPQDAGGAGQYLPVVILPDQYAVQPEFSQFLNKEHGAEVPGDLTNKGGRIEVIRQTYNSLALKVQAPEKAVLFWRNAYFPHWRAEVNHQKTLIAPAFGAFKAIVVPQGESVVNFRFSPGVLSFSFLLAYSVFLVSIGMWVFTWYREHRITKVTL